MSSQLQRPNRPHSPQSSEPAAATAAKTQGKPKLEATPRRPSRRPDAKRSERQEVKPPPEAVLVYGDYKAGDAIQLPFSGKTVAVTHFYTTASGTWYAAHDKGFVRLAAIADPS